MGSSPARTGVAPGSLDSLVNNAVVRYFGAIENFAPELWKWWGADAAQLSSASRT
jgi:hypothetical protein